MSLNILKGIVIKSVDYKESDKIVTLLTFEKGRVTAIAKGVRKKGAKLAHASQFLYCGEFELVLAHNRLILTGASNILDLSEISNNLKRYYFAAHYIDIAKAIIMEEQADEAVMKLLLNTLYTLSKGKLDEKLLTILFEYRMIMLNGFAPLTEHCVICGKESSTMKLSVLHGGLVCCKGGMTIRKEAIKIIKIIVSCSDQELFSIRIDDSIIAELYFTSRKYVEGIFDRQFTFAEQGLKYE